MSLPLTGLDIVQTGRVARLESSSQPRPVEQEMAEGTLKRVGVGHLVDILRSAVSGGRFQMILIAGVLVAESKISVLDRPEVGLGFHGQLAALQLLCHLADSGLIAMMNAHYSARAIHIADQVLLLDSQHRTLNGSTTETLTRSHLSDLFDADVRIVRTCSAGTKVPTITSVGLQR